MHAPQINPRTPQTGDFKVFFRIVHALTNRIIRVIVLIKYLYLYKIILSRPEAHI